MTDATLDVLVVDDDYRVASVHVGFVERIEGFRVVGVAHTATEAISLGESLSPDVVLMDIYLPDGDGLAAVQRLLARPVPPAVLIISAANDIDNVRSALRLGVSHYLVKPFAFAALSDRLSTIRSVSARISELPAEASQEDINAVFESLRLSPEQTARPEQHHLAPTLQLVFSALADSDGGLSASDVAARVGISRATAQRALSQLEQSEAIVLELKYGHTGRPEHRYTVRRRVRN